MVQPPFLPSGERLASVAAQKWAKAGLGVWLAGRALANSVRLDPTTVLMPPAQGAGERRGPSLIKSVVSTRAELYISNLGK